MVCEKRRLIRLHAKGCYKRWRVYFGRKGADQLYRDHLAGAMVLHYRDCRTCQQQRIGQVMKETRTRHDDVRCAG